MQPVLQSVSQQNVQLLNLLVLSTNVFTNAKQAVSLKTAKHYSDMTTSTLKVS